MAIKRHLLAAILLTCLATTHVWAEQWPTTKFEVFEGVPWNSKDTLVLDAGKLLEMAMDLDERQPASVPLTPELRYEIEEYLGQVARHYEQYFPAPKLEPMVDRDDGTRAFRVYYFDIQGPDAGYAQYVNTCNDSTRFRVEINAARLTRGGKITAKGYGDLAHELFHAVQRNTAAGRLSKCAKGVGDWAIEGQAEAIGHDMARTFRRSEDGTQKFRWGLRHYSESLFVSPRGPRSRAYQTSSFWRYLAELQALRARGKRDIEGKPGPDRPTDYETDYSYLGDLMSRQAPGTGERQEIQWLNDWLNSYFGVDLSRTIPDFFAVYAQYGLYRVDGSKIKASNPDDYWREIGFGGSGNGKTSGCETITLDSTHDDASVNLELKQVAADCVELDIGDTGTPLSWTIQVIAKDKDNLKQLRLAMAGGQQVSTSAPMKNLPEQSGAVASWVFFLDPQKKQYLIVSNVAKEANKTLAQDIVLHFTLTGRDDNQLPVNTQRDAKTAHVKDAKPGPAGTLQTRERRITEMSLGPRGAGTSTWEFEEASGDCSGRKRSTNCQSRIIFKLSAAAPEQLMPGMTPAAGLGGLIGQGLMLSGDMEAMMGTMRYGDEHQGAEVTIDVKGIDYGFTGTINNVDILVTGTDEADRLFSRDSKPDDSRPPCLYTRPNGSLTIEEFTPLIIRGSYSAKLVADAVIRNVRKCPGNPVVDSIEGRFVIAAPLMADGRTEVDISWLREDQTNDINQMLPAGMQMDEAGGFMDTPTVSGDPGGFDSFDEGEDELDTENCDCSCENIRKGMNLTRNMMSGGQPDEEAMRLTMCIGQCLAEMPECPLGFD